MSLSYINSNDVQHVFPCVSRPDKPESKLMSEKNITNILKSITDRESYVIDYDIPTKTIRFVLEGYYFEVKNFDLNGNKYAKIGYRSESDSPLIGPDNSDGEFTGLEIHSDVPSGHYLTLCTITNSVPGIPASSFIKFNAESLEIVNIDCGELN